METILNSLQFFKLRTVGAGKCCSIILYFQQQNYKVRINTVVFCLNSETIFIILSESLFVRNISNTFLSKKYFYFENLVILFIILSSYLLQILETIKNIDIESPYSTTSKILLKMFKIIRL